MQELNRPGFKVTFDEARFLVRYQIGPQTIDERIGASVTCNEMSMAAVGVQHHCTAGVFRMFAPAGKLEAAMPTLKSITTTMNPQWNAEWNAAMVQRTRRLYEAQTKEMLERGRQAEAAPMRQHQDFMASMQRGKALRDQQFREGQFVKQQNKEDYVDYLLDCHRLVDGRNMLSIGNCANRETAPR
jgi:hypothetical protein